VDELEAPLEDMVPVRRGFAQGHGRRHPASSGRAAELEPGRASFDSGFESRPVRYPASVAGWGGRRGGNRIRTRSRRATRRGAGNRVAAADTAETSAHVDR